MGDKYIVETGARADTGGNVGSAVLCAQEEDGHLGTGDRVIRAVVAAAATGGDAIGVEFLDPIDRPVGYRHISKDGPGPNGGSVG